MSTPDPHESGGEQFFDAALAKSLLAFGVGAVRRRKVVAALVFAAIVAVTIVAAIVLPRTYYTETKLIAQRNAVMTVRADQNWDAFRGVSETVLSHDNIVAMVRQTELVKNWNARRPPLNKFKDSLMDMMRGPLSEETQVQGLAYMLADRLNMSIGDGQINISIYWPEPVMAARLAEAAQQSFLEARHDAEIQSLVELVSIDEQHSSELLEKVRVTAEQVKSARDQKIAQIENQATAAPSAAAPGATPSAPRRVTTRTRVPDSALAELKTQYEEKKKKLKDIEDERRRKRLDAQNLLGELKGKFTEEYPEVRRQQAKVAALTDATAEEKALSADVDDLEEQMSHRGEQMLAGSAASTRVDVGGTASAGPAADPIPPEIRRLLQDTSDDKDPILGAQLRSATNEYASILDQIVRERRELDKAQAAFKYRYRIVQPVEVPNKPIKPKIPAVIAAGIIAGIALGLLSAIAAEIRAGRIRAKWQVERLKLPVLAELVYPSILRE